MKKFLLSLLIVLTAGCQSWPKDSLIQGAESTVNTPWGPSTIKADVIATGKAAQLVTIEQLEARVKELKAKKADEAKR